LGWSLDDSTEDFSIDQMLEHFTTGRITKSPASFDPAKLLAFQGRWMHKLTVAQRSEMCLPYLKSAGLIEADSSIDAAVLSKVERIVSGAGDRIKVAGDILDYDDFFSPADQLNYDDAAFEKRVTNDAAAVALLQKFVPVLEGLDDFSPESIESVLKQFIESEGVKIKNIIHALRLTTTGKAVGFGMFETLSIIGQADTLSRIQSSLSR
jgi:glutamyl-tRNA synthetase